jgi:hypothetical protein
MSEFDSIGSLDDTSITTEQSAILTTSFSEALFEIQRELFQPIRRQIVLEKRGPLYRPPQTFEGRKVRPRIEKNLHSISTTLKKRSAKLHHKGDIFGPAIVEDGLGEMLPPSYRASIKDTLQTPTVSTFTKLSARIKEQIDEADRRLKSRRPPPPPEPKRKSPEIISNYQPPPPPQPAPPPVPAPKPDPVRFAQVRRPEHMFFDSRELELEPIAGVSTGDCLEGIDRLFAPLPTAAERVREASLDPLAMPVLSKPRTELPESAYAFQTSRERIASIVQNDTILIVVDEKLAQEEHTGITGLWDQLKLAPVTRLKMAAKLCALVSDDAGSNDQFRAVMGATTDFKNYNVAYKKFKDLLTYEPGVGAESSAADLLEVAKEFRSAEDAFKLANQEMITILGAEIQTEKGGISQLIAKRARKIQELKLYVNLDQPQEQARPSSS